MDSELLFKDERLSSAEAHSLLARYQPSIAESIHGGVAAWQKIREQCPSEAGRLKPTAIANIIHNNIEHTARSLFANMEPDIYISHDTGFLLLDIEGRVKLRFKKLRDNLHPRNVDTQQQRKLTEQTLFSGPYVVLTARYRYDPLAHEIRDMHIVYLEDGKLIWNLPLVTGPAEVASPQEAVADVPEPDVIFKKSKSHKQQSIGG